MPPSAPRLAEATAVMAVATDVATGMPTTTSLRICLAALRIADIIDDDSLDRRALYHYCLVRLLGCTVENSGFSAAMGNEFAVSHAMAPIDQASPREMMPVLLHHVGSGLPPLARARQLARTFKFGNAMRTAMAGHCEVSRMLTHDLGLGHDVALALDHTYERWDGKGMPKGVKGEEIPLITRVMHGAYQAVVQEWADGLERVQTVARRRSGGALDPRVAAVLEQHAGDILDATHVTSAWDAVLAADPSPRSTLDARQVDATATAIACFADLKFDLLAGHSSNVARVSVAAADVQGIAAHDVAELRRAALVHDAGRVAVSNVVWDHPGPLDDAQWEEVRLHAYHSERIVGRVPWLADAARVASSHHERCDGSGYHRGSRTQELTASARILAAADMYCALQETRAHRPARTAAEAARVVCDEAEGGRLDASAVQAVLEGAGHAFVSPRPAFPAGLSEREVEVLRMIARGATIKAAAEQLHLSPKTVDTHVQHVYGKIGCNTRAGATVFAMREGLLDPPL